MKKLSNAQRRVLEALRDEPRTAIDLWIEYRVRIVTLIALEDRGFIQCNIPPLRGLHSLTELGRAALEESSK